jgi:outer membrane lipoprotein-sorting protein
MKRGVKVLAAVVVLSAMSAAQTADDIIAKAIAARGGLDKIKAVQTVRLTATIAFGTQGSGKLLVEMKRPGKIREELAAAGRVVIRTSDGAKGWDLNQFTGGNEAQPLPADEMNTMAQKADFDRPFVDYKAKGHKVELLGKDMVKDKPAHKIKITLKEGDVRYDYFDAASYQEVKWTGTIPIQGKSVEATSYFSDYREVGGVTFPYVIESSTGDNPEGQRLTFEKIEVNVALDDSRFGKPTAPAPEGATADGIR